MATTKITLNELRSIVKQIIKEQVTSTENINVGDEFNYKLGSNYPQDLSPIKIKVVKIINKLYFGGQITMIPNDTAKYLNGHLKTGMTLQCHVENIERN